MQVKAEDPAKRPCPQDVPAKGDDLPDLRIAGFNF